MSGKEAHLTFAYDIGHSSIGWAVLEGKSGNAEPELLGTGVVTFPADDCLASQRRTFRRQRRHIRATRQRIDRIAKLLNHLEVLTPEETSKRGNSSPYLDAAEVLNGVKHLTWFELWNVLRWYAHNRGYDGNKRWKRGEPEEDAEDTEKVANAHQLMRKHGTDTMAETVSAALGLKLGSNRRSSQRGYKTLNVAFPREIVVNEVRKILELHEGKLKKIDRDFIETLIAPDNSRAAAQAWSRISVPEIHLPKRYTGGLLFGQLVPRFDNRILTRCPFSGEKVPAKACMDYYRFRWAMILANIRVDGAPLSSEARKDIDQRMREKGRLTKSELAKAVEEATGSNDHNLKTYFGIHPDSEKALEVDPARAMAYSGENKRTGLYPFWNELSESVKERAINRWKKNKPVTVGWMIEAMEQTGENTEGLEQVVETEWNKRGKGKKKSSYLTRDHVYRKPFVPSEISGRAPYSRAMMKATTDFVLNTNRHPSEKGGPLERTPELLEREQKRHIDDLTNNHLVRHRLKILKRLTSDMVRSYAGNDPDKVKTVVVEVASELKEFSGKTTKEIESELKGKLKDFNDAVKYLEKKKVPNISGSLIRKCRIAQDQNWTCPFTGQKFDPHNLTHMEREHIIPRSIMQTDAMYALVLTYPEVNRMKGNRTARRFIEEEQGNLVTGRDNLSILTSRRYENLVDKLPTKGHPQDVSRMKKRKQLMTVMDMQERETGFTEGSLTQTSQLVRLAAAQLSKNLPSIDPHHVISFPGQVTAIVRKSWDLLGCLSAPEVCGDRVKDKTKTEIREITHLHHAVDAITLAYASFYFPRNASWEGATQPGALWRAMVARNPTEDQCLLLERCALFYSRPNRSGRKRYELEDIPRTLKAQAAERLAEKRVVQHVPADMHGMKAELNTWGVMDIDGDPKNPNTRVSIRQNTIQEVVDSTRIRKKKTETEKAGKLLGLNPKNGTGKLKDINGVLVIKSNYGMALDPEPTIIPFHKVWHRIQNLKELNGGQHPRILRNGMLIKISGHSEKRDGIWKVFSVQSSLKIDLGKPDLIKRESKGIQVWREVKVDTLLKKDCLEILYYPFTGNPS